jgi:hypothetical protein
MELAQIAATFESWAQSLTDRGITTRFSNRLAGDGQDLVLTALLLSGRPDTQHRAYRAPRREAVASPVARLRYLIALGSGHDSEPPVATALVELIRWSDDTPDLEVLQASLAPSDWLAWELAPRPAFLLEATVTERVEPPSVPVVEHHEVSLINERTSDEEYE